MIDTITEEEEEGGFPFQEVFSTGDSFLLQLIKSLLENEEIPYLVIGEDFLGLLGGAVPFQTEAKILVPENSVAIVKNILEKGDFEE